MARMTTVAALLVVGVLLVAATGPAAAHSWQTTVELGPMELGLGSSPETPVAGMETEYSARIADADPAGDADRLDWGGVVNETVEVHIRGPDGYHDHVSAEIPEDDAHFHWTYVYPTDGSYSIAVVTELEGEEYAFQFEENVTLLPARATGEELEHLADDVHAVSENVDGVSQDVDAVSQDVSETNEKVESLQSQVNTLQERLASHDSDEVTGADVTEAQLPGFGVTASLVALAAILAFAAGRRRRG